jgi:hypothetical protein
MTIYLVREADHVSEVVDPVDNEGLESAASSDDWGTPPRSQAQGMWVEEQSVLEQVGESGRSGRHQVPAGKHKAGFSHSGDGSPHGGKFTSLSTLHII